MANIDKMEYRKHAESLIEEPLELCKQVMIKHMAAILEEIHDQIEVRDERIERLEKTLGTTITWLQKDFGDHGVKQLLDMLKGAIDKTNG